MIYFFLVERVKKYIALLAIQGVMLFAVAFLNLESEHLAQFILVVTETLIVKAFAIPWFMMKLRRQNNLDRMHSTRMPVFFAILTMTAIIILSFALAWYIENPLIDLKFFTIALSLLLGGIFFTIIHQNIFSHIIGLLIIENGAFLFSLAVGSEFPILVSMAVTIDLLIALLVIGVFINKIGDKLADLNVPALSRIKD
jgi:hydrogenase-4 component E